MSSICRLVVGGFAVLGVLGSTGYLVFTISLIYFAIFDYFA